MFHSHHCVQNADCNADNKSQLPNSYNHTSLLNLHFVISVVLDKLQILLILFNNSPHLRVVRALQLIYNFRGPGQLLS